MHVTLSLKCRDRVAVVPLRKTVVRRYIRCVPTKCFEPFTLDVVNQCLWHGQTRVSLMPKPFAVLTYLVEHAGRLITQDELLNAVWPDTHVQPDVLRKHIKEVRRVLGDVAATPRFIETLPKRGYRFVAPVWDQLEPTAGIGRLPPTLVGRESVFAALDDRLRRAISGERQLVFLSGESGIGKTSVVEAFAQAVASIEQVRIAWGQAVEGFAGKEPYYPVLEALGRFGRGPDGALLIDALARCAPTWLIQLPALVPPDRRAGVDREALGATTPRMVRELCEALETITRAMSLVLVIEDLHWVDHATLDALSAIARRREPARLLVIGTYRPVDVILSDNPFKSLRRDLCLHGLAHDIALEPLTAPEIGHYIGRAFSPNHLTGLERVLHHHSGGNPLFMAATLDHLVKRGVIEWDGSCWRMSVPLEQLGPDVPETLRHVLDLQLEQLTGDQGRVLMCASVAGERFSSWDVATMLGDERMDADDVCIALVERGQFLRTALDAERAGKLHTTYEFTHALYRNALYRRLPSGTRIAYHRRLAHGLDRLRAAGHDDVAGTAAAHYEAAGVYDRAVSSTVVAAGNALRRYAHAEALALLTHARALNQQTADAETGARELELLQRRGDVEYARGEMALAADAYDQAAAAAIRAGLPAAAAQVLIRAARSAGFFDVSRALDACDRAAQVAINAGLMTVKARATLVRLCWTLLHRGWSRAQADAATVALETLLRSNADLTPADHILFANVQVFRAEYADAAARADAALAQLDPTDSLWEHLGALAAKGGALALQGRLGAAHRTLTTAIEIARKNDNAPWLDILTGLFGSLHFEAGDFAAAAEIAASRLPAGSLECAAPSQMHLLVVSGAAELGLGRVADARLRFSAVRAYPMQDLPIVHWYWRLQAQLGMVEAMLVAGDVAAARAEITDLTAAAASLDEVFVRALAWESRARVEMRGNAIDSAVTSIGRALECLASHEVPTAAWRVHATAAGILHRTDPPLAASHAERARAIVTRMAESLEGYPRLQQSLLAMPVIRTLVHGHSTTAAARDPRNRRSRQLS